MGAKPLSQLQPQLGRVHAVRGNNDFPAVWPSDETHVLEEIPEVLYLNLPGGSLVMEHSHRVWDKDYTKIHQLLREDYPEADLIIYGHTHIRHIDDTAHPWVANPGAAGRVRVHDAPSCLELTVSSDAWTIKEHLFSVEYTA